MLLCGCLCYASLPRGSMDCSEICGCGTDLEVSFPLLSLLYDFKCVASKTNNEQVEYRC